MKKSQKAFSLIELLAVVTIIAVLASLSLPSLSHATFQARNTICKNNLRQVGLAMQFYVTTYEAYPPYSKQVGGNGETSTVYTWDQLLESNLFPDRKIEPVLYASGRGPGRDSIEQTFLCPFFVPRRPNMPFDLIRWVRAPIYGYNSFGIPRTGDLGIGSTVSQEMPVEHWRIVRESSVVAPSDLIAAGDPFSRSPIPSQDALFQGGPGWQPVNRVKPGWDTVWDVRFYLGKSPAAVKIHRARFNKLFCDGHIATENFNRPFVASDEYLRQWNRDHEPHRDLWETQ